jgi:hypothetical protein
MSNEFVRLFERVSDWMEYKNFQDMHEGYITKEKINNNRIAMFLWRHEEEPVLLDHMFLGGDIYVKISH